MKKNNELNKPDHDCDVETFKKNLKDNIKKILRSVSSKSNYNPFTGRLVKNPNCYGYQGS